MKYKNEKLKIYSKEATKRFKSVLPAKDKEDILYKMYFGKNKGLKRQLSSDELWDFVHWYERNDHVVRAEFLNLLDSGYIKCDIDWTNIRLA